MTEITEDIVPAVKVADILPREITAEDFQKQLFSWFQDKGLMAELRSHLRVKMIGILKNASVDSKVRSSFSPKLQAVNLLIAEYLLYKEYHYSLSVFSTEVPLTNEFQDYSLHDGRVKKYQFSENDMWDILEILGITNDSDEGKDVSTNYYKANNTEPLLTCVIRTLHNMNKKSRTAIAEVNINALENVAHLNTENKDHLLLRSITNLLIQAKVTPKCIADITEQFSQIIRTETDRITEQKHKECLYIKQQIKLDSRQRIDRCKQKVFNLEKAFAIERERLHSELEKSKADIQECALQLQSRTNQLNEQEKLLSTKELDLVVKEDAIAKKEKLLASKESNLTEREDRLHTDLQALYIEKLKLNEMKQRMRRISPHKSDKFCLNPQQPENAQIIPSITINKEQQTLEVHNIENVLLKQTIRQLHLENETLRGQMNFQNARINELNQQTNNLTVEISNLRQCLTANNNTMQPTNNYPMPPSNSFNYLQALSFDAGGDKRIGPPPVAYNNNHDNQRHYMAFKTDKASSKPLSPMASSCSSPLGASPTDSILKAAKVRLMTLENESREIERNFEKYKNRPRMDFYSNNWPEYPSVNKSNVSLVEKLNSNIAIVRENISKLIFDSNFIDADALLNEEVQQITKCTATPCAVEFHGNFNYNNLIADIPGSEYDMDADEQDGYPIQGSISNIDLSTDLSDTDHDQRVEANIGAVSGE